jgi:hypothetical protein
MANAFALPSVTRLAAVLLLAGCQKQPATQAATLPTVQMKIGDKRYTLEIAADDAAREHGLMARKFMPADHGMIFVFDDDRVRSFWMKNTLIPLDIIFMDASGRVVSVRTMEANDLTTTSSLAPARYAIELNAGAVADCGVKPRDLLIVPAAVDAALKK